MQHHTSLRLALLGGAALALAALVASPRMAPATNDGHESLSELMARWRVFVEQYRDVPRDERVRDSKQFFAEIPWDNIRYLCLQGSPGVGPDSTEIVQYVVNYRVEQAPPGIETMVEFIRDPDIEVACKGSLQAWAVSHRDSVAGPDRDRLARAFLSIAAHPVCDYITASSFYVTAAAISSQDTLMPVMMTFARSPDTLQARRGVIMLASSADPRSADSLATLVRTWWKGSSPTFNHAVDFCKDECAELALDVLIESLQDIRYPRQRLKTLGAIASVPSLRAARALVDAYGDGGVVRDSTFAATGEKRSRYYELWLATRIAEPHLLAWLETGDDEGALLALELLDRAFRFGPADDDDAVVAALESRADASSGELRRRALEVHARALHPPQSGR
jgi:hypothetical protein